MSAAHQDPPAVARQRVRRALRAFRDALPWSQGEVASKLGWSLSKMQRIEGGEVAVSVTDLRALLDVYEVNDRQLVDRLVSDARIARRQRYVTAPEYREHLSPGLLELMQFEERAISVKNYQPMSYPGAFQTPNVAEVILDAWRDQLTPDQRRVRYEARMTRRQRLLERAQEMELFVILDESVIKRRLGNAEITAAQLEDLAEMAGRPNVHLRIVPLIKGAYTPALTSFEIMRLSNDPGDAVLYLEMNSRDDLIKDAAEIAFYETAFNNLWEQSLSEDATTRVVRVESLQLRSELDKEAVVARENS